MFPFVLRAWLRRPRLTPFRGLAVLLILCAVPDRSNHWCLVLAYFLVWWCGAMAAAACFDGGVVVGSIGSPIGWLIALNTIAALCDGDRRVSWTWAVSVSYVSALFLCDCRLGGLIRSDRGMAGGPTGTGVKRGFRVRVSIVRDLRFALPDPGRLAPLPIPVGGWLLQQCCWLEPRSSATGSLADGCHEPG